jgi:hypothetical protein
MRRARRVQARRSSWAKHIDELLKAPIAKSPEEWMANPNRLDLPNVDTNKPKKTKSCRVYESYLWKNDNIKKFDRLINKDDIEEKNVANQKVINQIMKTLNENNIPYYYGGEDSGIQVLKKDMQRAEKITNKLYNALTKTLTN